MKEICGVCGKAIDEGGAVNCVGCGKNVHYPWAPFAKENCCVLIPQSMACAHAYVCKQCAQEKEFVDILTRHML